MKLLRISALLLGTLPLLAGTTDVTLDQNVLVRNGETLVFDLFTWNYAANAQSFGLPVTPTGLSFALTTSLMDGPAQFSATLSTPDASLSVPSGLPLNLTPGYLSGSGYQGFVSVLQAQWNFDPLLAADIFASGSVRLSFLNTGADVTLGLSGQTLRQDLFACLSGGPLSVGALPGNVTLETTDPEFAPLLLSDLDELPDSVPEPQSGGLLLGGGTMLCVVSALLRKFSAGPR